MDYTTAMEKLRKAHSVIWTNDALEEKGGYGKRDNNTNSNGNDNTDKGEVEKQNT